MYNNSVPLNNTVEAPQLLSEQGLGVLDKPDRLKPPISYRLNIAENAPPGDHIIEFIFTYSDGSKWYQDGRQVLLHVNNPIEQYRYLVAILIGIVGLGLTWISGSDTAKKEISEFVERKVEIKWIIRIVILAVVVASVVLIWLIIASF